MRVRLAIAASALALGAAVTPAQAAVSVSSFSITPSTTQAGANPDVTVDAKFSSTDGDTINDATVSLAPGLLADPSAPKMCAAPDFAAQTCPRSSQIGDGTITATAPSFGTTVSLPIGIYLIAPRGSELARIGVIADFFDSPAATVSAPVQLRTAPTVGLDLPLTGIPDEVSGTAVEIDELSLRLQGTVNGKPFTRNPTACSPATTGISFESYGDPATPVTATASYTPTGCATLGYAPQLAATATAEGDGSAAFDATITQNAADAATRSVSMILPPGLGLRLSALSGACTAADIGTCPSIGTATVTTPLLTAPVQGQLTLVAHPGSLPTIDATFPAPLSLTLEGTPSLGSSGLDATFADLPDVPITTLEVDFAGGANSVLIAGSGLCSAPQMLSGQFVAQSGAMASLAPAVTVEGCPGRGPAGGTGPTGPTGPTAPGGSVGGVHRRKKAGKPTAKLMLASLGGRHPRLTLTVDAGANAPSLARLGLRLPPGLRIVRRSFRRGLRITLDGRKLGPSSGSLAGGLTVALTRHGRSATITLTGLALTVNKTLINRLAHHAMLTLMLTVTDATGHRTVLRLSARG